MLIEPNSEGRFRQPGSPQAEREFNRERNEELAAALAGEIGWEARCAELERQNAALRSTLEYADQALAGAANAGCVRLKIKDTLQLVAGSERTTAALEHAKTTNNATKDTLL